MILNKAAAIALEQAFADAWNRGDIVAACATYSEDASFISKKTGHIRGKENIIAYYREAYRDKAAMGLLTLELDMFSTPPSSEAANTATAIIRYTVRDESGEEF